jgi:hypothetical protein
MDTNISYEINKITTDLNNLNISKINPDEEYIFVKKTLTYAEMYINMNISNKHICDYMSKTLNKLHFYKDMLCLDVDNSIYYDMSSTKKKQFRIIIRKLHNLIVYINKYESYKINDVLEKIRTFNKLIIKFIDI